MTQKIYTSEEFWKLVENELDASAKRFAEKIRASNRTKKQHNPFSHV